MYVIERDVIRFTGHSLCIQGIAPADVAQEHIIDRILAGEV